MTRADRAVSSPIEYVLTITIATILITGLIVAATGHVDDQRTRTTQAQMDAAGQQLAGNLERADRLVQMDSSDDPDIPELQLQADLPEQVLDNEYSLSVDDADSEIHVDSVAADWTVTVEYDVGLDVEDDSGDDPELQGGPATIEYDPDDYPPDTLVVTQ